MRFIITVCMLALYFVGGIYTGQYLLKNDIANASEIEVDHSVYKCKLVKRVK